MPKNVGTLFVGEMSCLGQYLTGIERHIVVAQNEKLVTYLALSRVIEYRALESLLCLQAAHFVASWNDKMLLFKYSRSFLIERKPSVLSCKLPELAVLMSHLLGLDMVGKNSG